MQKNGGSCIVENTTRGIDRQVRYLKKVSEDTGVHIIAPSGYYTDITHPPNMSKLSVEDLAMEMVADVTEGVDGTPIKCGVIGELGCSWPLTGDLHCAHCLLVFQHLNEYRTYCTPGACHYTLS